MIEFVKGEVDDYATIIFRPAEGALENLLECVRENEADVQEPGLYWAGNIGGWVEAELGDNHHLNLDSSDRLVYRGSFAQFFTKGYARLIFNYVAKESDYPKVEFFLCNDKTVKAVWDNHTEHARILARTTPRRRR